MNWKDKKLWIGVLVIFVVLIGLWFFYPKEEHTLCANCCGPPPCCSYCGEEIKQCIVKSPECDEWCDEGIDSTIDDTEGKTGQILKASEICCC